ncbi:MAG: YesL family protein [Lachnospiraceae bacterium]|nr:YesL family protein [Lachnospiraceae bacterium]
MNIFNYDSGIMRAVNKFTDCMFLSILFLISCIPLFTIGTAMTALYYTAYKVLRGDRGYIFRDYVQAFRNNFRQTMPVWLLVAAMAAVLTADWNIMRQYIGDKNLLGALEVLFFVAMSMFSVWISYLFAYMARFEDTRRRSLKNAALMELAHLSRTFLLLALAVLTMFLFYMAPLLILFLPAASAWLQSYILEGIFRKYMSAQERKTEEEREQA